MFNRHFVIGEIIEGKWCRLYNWQLDEYYSIVLCKEERVLCRIFAALGPEPDTIYIPE